MLTLHQVNFAYDQIYSVDNKGRKKATSRNLSHLSIEPQGSFDYSTVEEQAEKLGLKLPVVEVEELTVEQKDWLHELNALSPSRYFDNTLDNINTFSLEEVYNTPELKFNYPIVLFSDKLFEHKQIELPQKLITCLKRNQATLVFCILTEGWFGSKIKHFQQLHNVSNKYNLKQEQLYVLSANLKSQILYTDFLKGHTVDPKVTIYGYNYFKNLVWFYPDSKETPSILNDEYRAKLVEFHYKCKTLRNKMMFSKHFLCFNRAPRLHRLFAFGELMSNRKLIGKSITTLGRAYNDNKQAFFFATRALLEDTYRHCKDRLLNFYENYNSISSYSYDIPNIKETNAASNLNVNLHNSTFVNIVTETLFDNDSVFISEKLYKPILCCQPFIVVGSPNYLKKLRELGFETFSDIWDESYDEEENTTERFAKIVDTLEDIASWDPHKQNLIQNILSERLTRNFEKLTDPTEPYKLFEFLNK